MTERFLKLGQFTEAPDLYILYVSTDRTNRDDRNIFEKVSDWAAWLNLKVTAASGRERAAVFRNLTV